MKKVTSQQIERLYQFTQQHYVEYYDVQTELVDHLANAIETHWETNPNDDFEIILQKEFRKFGVFGFTELVDEKIKQMEKRYYKLMWKEAKCFFNFPKIMLTISVCLLMFSIFLLFENKMITGGILVFLIIGGIIILTAKYLKKYTKNKEKKWLFEKIIISNNYTPIIFSSIIINTNILFVRNFSDNWIYSLIYSIFLTFLLLYVYLSIYYIPKNMKKYLIEIYPEYQISKG